MPAAASSCLKVVNKIPPEPQQQKGADDTELYMELGLDTIPQAR